MRCAETGYNPDIDPARGNIERAETDPRMRETHPLGVRRGRQDTPGQGTL
jgi:hypothetical protein